MITRKSVELSKQARQSPTFKNATMLWREIVDNCNPTWDEMNQLTDATLWNVYGVWWSIIEIKQIKKESEMKTERLNFFAALFLFLLEWITGKEWTPKDDADVPEPPTEPDPPLDVPEWAEPFGDTTRYTSRYVRSQRKAVFAVTADKAAVFFPLPGESYEVQRPDGTTTLKHVFGARTNEDVEQIINISNGAHVLGYKDVIPNTTQADAKEYSDGGTRYYEICVPYGGVVRTDHVEMIGYEVAPNEWVEA